MEVVDVRVGGERGAIGGARPGDHAAGAVHRRRGKRHDANARARRSGRGGRDQRDVVAGGAEAGALLVQDAVIVDVVAGRDLAP